MINSVFLLPPEMALMCSMMSSPRTQYSAAASPPHCQSDSSSHRRRLRLAGVVTTTKQSSFIASPHLSSKCPVNVVVTTSDQLGLYSRGIGSPEATSGKHPKRIQIIRASSTGVGMAGSEPVVNKIFKFVDVSWRFSRPIAIQTTALGAASIAARVLMDNPSLIRWSFLIKALRGFVAIVCANAYITGINQVYDVDIDRVNKPELPIAAGDLSVKSAWFLVILYAVVGVSIVGMTCGPLVTAIYLLGLFLGTIYSAPPIRTKRFPFGAFLLTGTARGVLLSFGVYYATIAALGLTFQWSYPLTFITTFVTIFALVISITKDLPDVEGDQKFQISTMAIKFGVRNMALVASGLALLTYIGAVSTAIFIPEVFRSSIMVPAHVILASILVFQVRLLEKANYTKESLDKFYVFIWKLLAIEYIVFPFI